MITKLTPRQREKFPEFMDKWLANASGKTSHTACAKAIKNIYISIGEKSPKTLHFTSPILAALASCMLRSQLDSQLRSPLCSQLDSQLDSQLRSQLCSQLDSQLRSQLCSQLCSQLGSQLRSQLCSQLDSQLDSQLRSQLCSQLDSQLRSQLGSQLYTVVWWGTWACYYDFAKYTGVKFDMEKFRLFVNFTKNIHLCLPYKNIFIYSDKPVRCHWKGTRLHNETGKAVEYADGWGWYSLNGVMMKPEYVLTPAEKTTPETVLAEKNVDIRRELIRKVGVQRMLSRGQEIDHCGTYKLIDMSPVLTGIRYAPHLLMRNPSVDDTWHLEGVGPECHTVQEAINWRAGNIEVEWSPAQLS